MTYHGICRGVGVSSRKGGHFFILDKMVPTKIKPALRVGGGGGVIACSSGLSSLCEEQSNHWNVRVRQQFYYTSQKKCYYPVVLIWLHRLKILKIQSYYHKNIFQGNLFDNRVVTCKLPMAMDNLDKITFYDMVIKN